MTFCKHIATIVLVLAFACTSAGCHDPHPEAEPLPPPDSGTAEDVPQGFFFSAANPSEVTVDENFKSLNIITGRPADRSDKEETCHISVIEGGDALVPEGPAHFSAGDIHATAVLRYTVGALAEGQSRRITVTLKTPAAGTDGSLIFTLTRPVELPKKQKALYRCNGRTIEAEMTLTKTGESTTYNISAPDLQRRVTVSGSNISVSGKGLVDMAAAKAMIEEKGTRAHNIYSTRSSISNGGARINLALCHTDGNDFRPAVEYLITDAADWEDAGRCFVTDGWLLPVVAINAQLLDPDEHRWEVWAQRSTTTPGIYRIIDLYRGASPLSAINQADAGNELIIDCRDAAYVGIAPQKGIFVCPELFAFDYMIGDYGGWRGAAAKEEATASGLASTFDGTKITIALPLSNSRKGSEADFGQTLSVPVPTVFSIEH